MFKELNTLCRVGRLASGPRVHWFKSGPAAANEAPNLPSARPLRTPPNALRGVMKGLHVPSPHATARPTHPDSPSPVDDGSTEPAARTDSANSKRTYRDGSRQSNRSVAGAVAREHPLR